MQIERHIWSNASLSCGSAGVGGFAIARYEHSFDISTVATAEETSTVGESNKTGGRSAKHAVATHMLLISGVATIEKSPSKSLMFARVAHDELGANVVVSSKSSLLSLAVKLGDVKDGREQTWVEHTLSGGVFCAQYSVKLEQSIDDSSLDTWGLGETMSVRAEQ